MCCNTGKLKVSIVLILFPDNVSLKHYMLLINIYIFVLFIYLISLLFWLIFSMQQMALFLKSRHSRLERQWRFVICMISLLDRYNSLRQTTLRRSGISFKLLHDKERTQSRVKLGFIITDSM